MTSEGVGETSSKSKRLLLLVFLLNLLLLGALLYANFGRSFIPGGGVSIVIANDLLSPMVEMTLSYPGGTFAIPRLDAKKSVGSPIPATGAFEATLSFKDDRGNVVKQSFPIKPLGEFLIVIHVLNEFDETSVKAQDGKDEKLFRPSPARVKILTSYQGENVNI